jgi:uncharacterized caspase-like protein
MKKLVLCAFACGALLAPPPSTAAVQRVALVMGANDGGSGRTRLKYAVADAERFARVLYDLGGVEPAQAIVLRQPSPRQMEDEFATLRARLAALKMAGAERTEALVYYSGHADHNGLLLSDDRLSYRTFRDFMDRLPADVRIGVIDACASGAITRIKGGRARPPFLVDAANSMRGHAFLTSSSANEVAQESDRIAASFFTHYLVSGLRGAADLSGEGTVTLGEAYQFAFRETLGRTAETRAGAQHPAYDLNLSGTGDVVITDVRQTSARLALGEDVGGRCFVRDAEQRLVVELLKPRGRAIDLGLAPGPHEVRCQDQERAHVARVTLQEGRQVVLNAADFAAGRLDRAMARGEAPERGAAARSRLDVSAGLGTDLVPRFGELGFTRWVAPRLALTFTAGQRGDWEFSNSEVEEKTEFGTFMLGARRYLSEAGSRRFNPFLEAGTGFFVRSSHRFQRQPTELPLSVSSRDVEPLAWLGAGFDLRLGRSLTFGMRWRYEQIGRFDGVHASPNEMSGLAASASFGFLLGGSKKP